MPTAQLPLAFVAPAAGARPRRRRQRGDKPVVKPVTDGTDTGSLEVPYREWRQTHEGQVVYAACRRQALTRLDQKRRFGIGALVEVVRWEMPGIAKAADGFKINNNHRAYLARELCAEIPGLAALIETRLVRR